jgi:phosphatidylserine/phosphatidylglycerophosphate/cardiolipin synthase-like enzyme
VHHVEALYLDMIKAAKDYIYIENQYFTSQKVGEALEARLREKGGPRSCS